MEIEHASKSSSSSSADEFHPDAFPLVFVFGLSRLWGHFENW